MAPLIVDLDDEAADRLRRRAEREGISITELARRLLADATAQDPFEFVGAFDSAVHGARDPDGFLTEHSFGTS